MEYKVSVHCEMQIYSCREVASLVDWIVIAGLLTITLWIKSGFPNLFVWARFLFKTRQNIGWLLQKEDGTRIRQMQKVIALNYDQDRSGINHTWNNYPCIVINLQQLKAIFCGHGIMWAYAWITVVFFVYLVFLFCFFKLHKTTRWHSLRILKLSFISFSLLLAIFRTDYLIRWQTVCSVTLVHQIFGV